ncbi:MAG: PH domain-containing protein [Clostridia bacterium]|nr:PH domain-containing protein [Clostridia bacterium]
MHEKPSPRVLWSWAAAALTAAIPLGVGSALLARYGAPTPALLFTALWVGLMLLTLCVYLPLRRRNLSFSLDEKRVCVTGGVVFITARYMDTRAVRQVTLLQGPVERLCHTAFLLVSATGGYLLIEGLDSDRAAEWCRRLSPS